MKAGAIAEAGLKDYLAWNLSQAQAQQHIFAKHPPMLLPHSHPPPQSPVSCFPARGPLGFGLDSSPCASVVATRRPCRFILRQLRQELQATEQGSRPPASFDAADPDPTRRPLVLGGTGCPKRSAVASLPDAVLVEILSRLPAKFPCRSKCVSREWCDLITDCLRCRKLPTALEGFFYGCADVVVRSDSDQDSSSRDCHSTDSYGSYDDGGSEDSDGGGSEDEDEGFSEDSHEVFSDNEDHGECKCGECLTKPHQVHGHFINLSGRSVPLVDPLFSFLRKQPRIMELTILDSCNGLLLFGHTQNLHYGDKTSYIVYNPATEHWVPVHGSGFTTITSEDDDSNDDIGKEGVSTYLIFDPAASLHFELIEFCNDSIVPVVQTYSSETKRWMDRASEWRRWEEGSNWNLHRTIKYMRGGTFLNKMLHLIIGPELIAAIDGKGKTCWVIPWVKNRGFPVFMDQSNGLLHCLSVSGPSLSYHMTKLSIWVLEDYDAEKWILKHTVSFTELFGKGSCQFGSDYIVATIHPDCNVVFFVQHWDYKLISYDLDRKEVRVLCTVGCDYGHITPYVPYFSETPLLTKH